MIKNLISESTLQHLAEIKTTFETAVPFKHVVIDDFFATDFCTDLLAQFPVFNDQDAIDENNKKGKKAVVQAVKKLGRAYKKLDQLLQSESFLRVIEDITGISELIYDPHYVGGGTHNNLHGQELDPHVDFTHHPIYQHHRRLNLIVYLNHQWEESWGGQIQFHQDPRSSDDEVISIEPIFNRAIIFETNNHSWHGFPPINLPEDKQHLSRKSFALYYYTKTRPLSVDPHSTIYVERPLAEKFNEGRKLSKKDVQELRSVIGRRDQHLRRLYDTITEQTRLIGQVKLEALRYRTLSLNPSKQAKIIERQLELLSHDEVQLLNRIQELENSSSWKITAPLRKLKRWFSS